MNGKELREKMEAWTLENSGWEERPYLGMSQIWRCQAELYDMMLDGWEWPGIVQAQLCYEGYLHKENTLFRLRLLEEVDPGVELVAGFDDRYRGHTDGVVGGMLLKVKSVGADRFEQVMEERRALGPDYDQVQAYMQYAGLDEAMVIYKGRERGRFWPVKVWANVRRQEKLEAKAKRVLAGVDAGERPPCTCGKHE